MRLSQLVSKRGIQPFSRDDFDFVASKVTLDPARLVLVGGQAIETWGVLFDVLAPTGDRHPLTEDADWLGSSDDARWLQGLLGRQTTELQIASPMDSGPSTALAYIERPDGRILMMDFLKAVAGLSNEEVRRLAVLVRIQGYALHVLHPLLCLDSRLANLALLPSKRHRNGVMQAEWAIDIASAFLNRMVAESVAAGDRRQAIKACHHIGEAAEYRHGRYCFMNYGLDPLRAVTPQSIKEIGGRFETEDWPRVVSRIANKRARWVAHAERMGR